MRVLRGSKTNQFQNCSPRQNDKGASANLSFQRVPWTRLPLKPMAFSWAVYFYYYGIIHPQFSFICVSPLLPYSSGGRSYGTGKVAIDSWLPEKNFCFTLKLSRPCRHTKGIYNYAAFSEKNPKILRSNHIFTVQQNSSYFRAIFNFHRQIYLQPPQIILFSKNKRALIFRNYGKVCKSLTKDIKKQNKPIGIWWPISTKHYVQSAGSL